MEKKDFFHYFVQKSSILYRNIVINLLSACWQFLYSWKSLSSSSTFSFLPYIPRFVIFFQDNQPLIFSWSYIVVKSFEKKLHQNSFHNILYSFWKIIFVAWIQTVTLHFLSFHLNDFIINIFSKNWLTDFFLSLLLTLKSINQSGYTMYIDLVHFYIFSFFHRVILQLYYKFSVI